MKEDFYSNFAMTDIIMPSNTPVRGITLMTSFYYSVPKAAIQNKIKAAFDKPDFISELEKLDIASFADKSWENPLMKSPDVYYKENEASHLFHNDIEMSVSVLKYIVNKSGYERELTILPLEVPGPETDKENISLPLKPWKPERHSESIVYFAFGDKVIKETESGTFETDRFIRGTKPDYETAIWTLQLLGICEEPVVYAVYDIQAASENKKFEWLKQGQKVGEREIRSYKTLSAFCLHYDDAAKIAKEKGFGVAVIRHRKYSRRHNTVVIEDIIPPDKL